MSKKSQPAVAGREMNEVEAYQVCNSAISALSHGETNLSIFPKLLRRIIAEEAWKTRRVPGKGMIEMQSLRELVTTPPIIGWGEDPAKIEAVIRDDAEVLAMWREAMKGKAGRPKRELETHRNPTQYKTPDRGRAYDLSRLRREAPELFERVKAGEMSANAAAIEAGFRRRKTALEKLKTAWSNASAEEREAFCRAEGLKQNAGQPVTETQDDQEVKNRVLAKILTPFQVREMASFARFYAKMKTMRLAKVKIHGAENEPDYSKYPTLEDIDRHCRENLGKSLAEIEEAA